MTKRRVTWFVIADGSRARILVKREVEPGYDVIAALHSDEAHQPSHELGSERPGRARESANAAHHAIAPREDFHLASKRSFVHEVAAHVNEAAERKAFDRLVLYVTPRSLAELKEALSAAALHKLTAAVAKDLTKVPVAELPQHFEKDL